MSESGAPTIAPVKTSDCAAEDGPHASASAEFLPRTAAKLLSVNRSDDRNRRLFTALLAGAGAAVLWYVFHGVYANLSALENAVGYVDPMTQGGIYFGYAVMVGGTLTLATIAVWSAYRYLRLLIGRDR